MEERNFKSGVIIPPKEIADIILKPINSSENANKLYNYLIKYKDVGKMVEIRTDDGVYRTPIKYVDNYIQLNEIQIIERANLTHMIYYEDVNGKHTFPIHMTTNETEETYVYELLEKLDFTYNTRLNIYLFDKANANRYTFEFEIYNSTQTINIGMYALGERVSYRTIRYTTQQDLTDRITIEELVNNNKKYQLVFNEGVLLWEEIQ